MRITLHRIYVLHSGYDFLLSGVPTVLVEKGTAPNLRRAEFSAALTNPRVSSVPAFPNLSLHRRTPMLELMQT